jgi:DNA-binding HxlR family transcriptional regulator
MTNIPRPGRPARGSQRGRPIMALLDLLGRRWTLRVIWELRERPLTFRELQSSCGSVSSSVLNQRLAELRAAGAIERSSDGYGLTLEGRRLLEMYHPLGAWAERWARRERRARGRAKPAAVAASGPGERSAPAAR